MTLIGTLRIAMAHLVRTPVPAVGERANSSGRIALLRRGSARVTLFWFVVALVALNIAAVVVSSDSRVRDPEYGRRVTQLRKRIAENPGRPLVLMLGSSRPAMGLRPGEWEAVRPADPSRPDPLIFNMALLGSGPVMELMALRRIYADGFRPALVLFEYWPPFLHQEGEWRETSRVAIDRLLPDDRKVVRDYFPEPQRIEREMNSRIRNPIWGYRERMIVQVLSRWVPPAKRTDWTWDDIDEWGWKPGLDLEPGLTELRAAAHTRCSKIYSPQFSTYQVSPIAERAFRESVALAREHGAEVGFVYFPESSEFRRLYPARVESLASAQFDRLSRELNVPLMNCREWLDDELIVDGFHPSRVGAAVFTRKFGPAVAATFPTLRNPPVKP